MRRTLILFTFAVALLLGAKTMGQTITNVTLGWSPSPSAGVAGYDIYYGTNSGNYISAVPVSGATATNVTIRGVTKGQTYYFAATAFDSAGNQSAFSPEISATAGAAAAAAQATAGIVSNVSGLPAGQFGIAVSGTTGAQYVVQASTDLVHWVALQTNFAPFQFVDSNRTQFSQRFYRTTSN